MAKRRRRWYAVLLLGFVANCIFLACLHWSSPHAAQHGLQPFSLETLLCRRDVTTMTSIRSTTRKAAVAALNAAFVNVSIKHQKNAQSNSLSRHPIEQTSAIKQGKDAKTQEVFKARLNPTVGKNRPKKFQDRNKLNHLEKNETGTESRLKLKKELESSDKGNNEHLSRKNNTQKNETISNETKNGPQQISSAQKGTVRFANKRNQLSRLTNSSVTKSDPQQQLSSWLKGTNVTRLDFVLQHLEDFPPDEHLGKMAFFFTPRPTLLHRSFPRILINCSRCPEDGPRLLVMVPSVAHNMKERQAIRNTWGGPAYGQLWPRNGRNLTDLVKLVFIFGVGKNADILQQESKRYRDIVQADFTDNYRNLSLKMATALQWSVQHCAGAGHVMKVDEDTFVDVPLMADLVLNVSSRRSNFIIGYKHEHAKPPVVRRGRWKVGTDVYPFPAFPRYVTGPSYVISGDAAKALASTSRRMPLVPNEDAYVTGILATAAGVQRIHCPSFAHEKLQFGRCELVDGRSVSQTRFKPHTRLYAMWDMVVSGRCQREG